MNRNSLSFAFLIKNVALRIVWGKFELTTPIQVVAGN